MCNSVPLRCTALALAIACPSWLGAQGIYTCVDAQGRKLVSDRPIPECLDRVQRELGSSGVVRRQIVPTTHQSTAEGASAARPAQDPVTDKAQREQRQQRALLDRYSSEGVHAEERKRALQTIDRSIAQTLQQLNERKGTAKDLNQQAASFKAKSTPLPRNLQMNIDENDQSITLLRSVLDERGLERKRTNERFDDELVLLRKLWAQGGIKP